MKLILVSLLLMSITAFAQQPQKFIESDNFLFALAPSRQASFFNGHRKLFQRNTGMIIGLQRGKYTSVELGGELHWRKLSLLKPHLIGATANLSYNPGKNVLGYHAGVWMKHGHINLTYGADITYFTDFNNRQAIGIGPSVGFRLFGFGLVNGFNVISANHSKTEEAPLPVNTFYMSLRYYVPVKNEFTWDRQTMKKKRARKRARIKRQQEMNRENKKKKSKENKWHLTWPFTKKQ